MTTSTPYDSPAEWLNDEIELLKATILVNSLARRLAEADPDEEAARRHRGRDSASQLQARHQEATAQQTVLQADLKARLDAHRDSDQPQLPIDGITEEDGLSDDERKLLIAAAIPALDNSVCSYALGFREGPYCGALSVGEIVRHVLAPTGTAEWVRCRLLFHGDSPLIAKAHLLLDDAYGPFTGETLGSRGVSISISTFARLVGEPRLNVESEGDPNDEQAGV